MYKHAYINTAFNRSSDEMKLLWLIDSSLTITFGFKYEKHLNVRLKYPVSVVLPFVQNSSAGILPDCINLTNCKNCLCSLPVTHFVILKVRFANQT